MSSNSTCLSGGADGADLLFGQLAAAHGHTVIHYGFAGMKSSASTLTILTPEQLKHTMPSIKEAAQFLNRSPPRKPYVRKLIQRNFYQVKTAETVYAITQWNLCPGDSNRTLEGQLGGGTGWAVAMAIAENVPYVYLFVMEKEQWYQYSYEKECWDKIHDIPTPVRGRYAGIGSRNLDEAGVKAIHKLYVSRPSSPHRLISAEGSYDETCKDFIDCV